MDVMINEWKTSGLLKPSVAMLDRIITAEKSLFISKLGGLASSDLEAVKLRWNQNMVL